MPLRGSFLLGEARMSGLLSDVFAFFAGPISQFALRLGLV